MRKQRDMDTFSKYLELAQKEVCRPFEVGQTVYLLTPQDGALWVELKSVSPGPQALMTVTVEIGGEDYLIDASGGKGLRVVFHPEEAAQFGQYMPIQDKAPVRCWDDEGAVMHIRFYDAENKCAFTEYACRGGDEFDHYEIIPDNQIDAVFGSRARYEEMKNRLED